MERKLGRAAVILLLVVLVMTAFPLHGLAASEKVSSIYSEKARQLMGNKNLIKNYSITKLSKETVRNRRKKVKRNTNLSMKAAAKRVKKFAKVGKKWIAECERQNKKFYYFSPDTIMVIVLYLIGCVYTG